MKSRNNIIGRLILNVVMISVPIFISSAPCLAEENSDVPPENLRLASLNITHSLVLPRVREIQSSKPGGLAHQDVARFPERMKPADLSVTASLVLPEFKEISPSLLERYAEPKVHGTGKPGFFKAVAHLVGSHLGIVTRPVSAVTKLFSLLFYTGQDGVRNLLLKDREPAATPHLDSGTAMDLSQWERDLDEITGTKLSSGRIRLLIDGEEFYSRLTDSFLEAEESIHMRVYIYDNDDYAMGMAELLKAKSEDVDVRVLVDGLGTIMANGVQPDSAPKDHRPAKSIKKYITKDSKVRMRFQKNLWLTLDHTKTILVDRKKVFIGGMNIGREYRYDWHDLMMEVDGPVVNALQNDFNGAWAYAGLLGDIGYAFRRRTAKKAEVHENDYPIRVLYTRTGDSQIYRAQLAAIKRSRKYIYIQTPYFSDDAMLQELVNARKRGVDVRVVMPLEGNWGVMNRSNKLAANTMLANGIRVYLYPHMSHVKAAVFDGWACVGSANFDKASFRTNQEINLATSDPGVVKELVERLFEPDFEQSALMTEPNPVRFADRFYELIADQM